MFVDECWTILYQNSLTPRARVSYNKEIDITTTHRFFDFFAFWRFYLLTLLKMSFLLLFVILLPIFRHFARVWIIDASVIVIDRELTHANDNMSSVFVAIETVFVEWNSL